MYETTWSSNPIPIYPVTVDPTSGWASLVTLVATINVSSTKK